MLLSGAGVFMMKGHMGPPLRFYESTFEPWTGGSRTRPYGGYGNHSLFS